MVRSTVSLAMTLVALSGGRTTTTLGFASIGRGARPSSSSSSFLSSSAVVVPPSRGDGGRPTTSGIASEGRRTRSNVVVVDVDDRRLASRRRGAASAVRLAIAVVLGAVVLLAPPFSPAARATTTSTFAPAAAAAAGIPTVPTFPTSRALGSFRLLPSGAELELCLRLLYAACCGAFVGLERSSSDRPAGVRTMALVGLGAAAYTVCSTHGFLPHAVLGIASGSPHLNNVKVDLSRMASNVASGVGFIGAGAIHKSRLAGVGTEEQNIVAGLTTAAAVWCSAAVGVASGAGLYYVAAVATFATTAILKYARVPKDRHEDHDDDDDGPGFSRRSTALTKSNDRVDDDGGRSRPHRGERAQERLTRRDEGSISGLFGKKDAVGNYNPENNAYVDQDAVYDRYSKDIHPIIIKGINDPRFEKYLGLLSRQGDNAEGVVATDVLIEEEQAVVSSRDVAKNEQDALEAEK